MSSGSETRRKDLHNVAIVAHVDHGKTTLVDAILRQTGDLKVKSDAAQDLLMDSNPQERERGITILSKCTSVSYKDTTINIVDTPGHADFGSEVERILKMVDGVLLLVDATDGPMPQTRFVLRKSLSLGLQPIVLINKVDRPHATPLKALDQTFNLFVDLGATDPQLDFPYLFASGKDGWASTHHDQPAKDLDLLFDTIVKHVPGPNANEEHPFQMQATMLDNNNFVGRIAIGRVYAGRVKVGQPLKLLKPSGQSHTGKVTKLYGFHKLERKEIQEAQAGDIIALAGAEHVQVGDTLVDPERTEGMPPLEIDEPTISMEFLVNDSPFSGKEGKFLTSRHIEERLEQEMKTNVGLYVNATGQQGVFKVSGRGELHLSVLIETMRREGFELAVSRPQVIDKEVDGKKMEPAEYLICDIDPTFQGPVMENLGQRGAEMKNMVVEGSSLRLEYVIPARALIGFKSEFLTQTKGLGLMHHSFHSYVPKTGQRAKRQNGSLVAKEKGTTTAYALDALQDRAVMFIGPTVDVYQGMIVGMNSREVDMVVNPCKAKQLTNMRAAGSDDTIQLTPPKVLTLEQAIEFIEEDELVEVTPASLRLRKKELNYTVRKRHD